MKKQLLIITILAITSVYGLRAQVQHFTWQGVEREYIVRTPTQHDGALPVLFFLHGQYVQIVPWDQGFNFSQMAEDFGWAIVVPQALDLGMGTMWNVGMVDSDVDDSGFLMALLDSLTVQYHLNPDSVFFTGFSMGGFMTYRMAIEHGDRITACAPVSGLISNVLSSVPPVAPVRILHIHGTDDDIVGYNGYSSFFQNNPIGLGVDEIIAFWRNANGCGEKPIIDTLHDLKNDDLRFIRYTYNCYTDLQLLKVQGGVHDWYNDSDQFDVGYMDVIHVFFTGHNQMHFDSVQESGYLHVWPNPTSGIFNVQLKDSYFLITELQVFDMYGKLLDRVEIFQELPLQTVQLDLSRYPNGVYFVREQSGAVAKVVVER